MLRKFQSCPDLKNATDEALHEPANQYPSRHLCGGCRTALGGLSSNQSRCWLSGRAALDGYPASYRRIRADHDEQIGNAIPGSRHTLSAALGYMGIWDQIWPGDILYCIGCAPASSPNSVKIPHPERVEDTGYECFEDYVADLRSYTNYGQCIDQKGFLPPHAKDDCVPAALNRSSQSMHRIIPSETYRRGSSEGGRRYAQIPSADYVSDGFCQRSWYWNNPMCPRGRPFTIFDGRLRRRNNIEESTTTTMFNKINHFSKHIPSTATYPVYAGYPAVLCGGPIRVSPYQLPPSFPGDDVGDRSRILTATTANFQNDFLRILDAEDGHGSVALDDDERSSPRRMQSLRRSLEIADGQRNSDTNPYRTRCYSVNIRLLREAENVRAKSAFCLFRHLAAPPCPPTAIRVFVDKLIKRGLTLMDGFVFLPVINDYIELAGGLISVIACVVRGGEELQESIEDERSLRWGVVFLCADKNVYEYQSEDTAQLLGSVDDLGSFGDRCLDML